MYANEQQTDAVTKPNGPAAAAVLAAGIGSFVLGLFVTLNEMSTEIHDFLDFSKNYGIGSGVGPLSGKVILAVGAYLLSWIVLAMLWRGKEVNFRGVFMLALVLLAFGFALTFPPIFLIFAAE
ncbi:MAG TPA: hypothetical protein VII26_04265 [Candidatus Limnocylindria bacterium]